MKINEEQLILNDGATIHLDSVKTLKMLNNKLMLVLHDGLVIEVDGLSRKEVDAIFIAYSSRLSQVEEMRRL